MGQKIGGDVYDDAMAYRTRSYTSPMGSHFLAADDVGVRVVGTGPDCEGSDDRVLTLSAEAGLLADRHLDAICTWLEWYFTDPASHAEPPVTLAAHGTPFQMKAWAALRRIPFGHTRTYAQQAASIGQPKATRAVGAANGRNALGIIIPCHRVIGSSGALTGFTGGLDKKQWLLDYEARLVGSLFSKTTQSPRVIES